MPKNKDVDAWFANYDNPMKPVVQKMREIILAADPRIEECIKWQAPTFSYRGNLASFFPKSKKHVSLMFHTGASIPGDHPRLEGSGKTSRSMKIASVAEANQAKADLKRIVKAWCALQDDGAMNKAPSKKKTARMPPVPKSSAGSDPYAKLKAHFAKVKGVTVNEGRGAQGMKAGAKMFAMFYKGDLLLTLPPKRVEALIKAGRALPHDPGTGKAMKNRVLVPASKKRSWIKLCEEAFESFR